MTVGIGLMATERRGFYDRRIAPLFVHNGCSMAAFKAMRARVVPKAEGIVLEAGFGSGLNLSFYDPRKVDRLIGIDPDPSMLRIAEKAQDETDIPIEIVTAGAESMPVESNSVDTVVVTYALCTIPDPEAALGEIRRVLRPGGRLLFAEHGRVDGSWCGRLQDGLNGLWGRIAGGCNLNRTPTDTIGKAGFAIASLTSERFPIQLYPLGSHCGGVATPR